MRYAHVVISVPLINLFFIKDVFTFPVFFIPAWDAVLLPHVPLSDCRLSYYFLECWLAGDSLSAFLSFFFTCIYSLVHFLKLIMIICYCLACFSSSKYWFFGVQHNSKEITLEWLKITKTYVSLKKTDVLTSWFIGEEGSILIDEIHPIVQLFCSSH